jgi:UDP-N-acetylmuramate--alanine ligase
MNKIKHIHFVGIKGVGMAPLAVIAKEAGFKVSGCDLVDEFITDEPLKKAGINPQIGFDKLHVSAVDLVVTTGAHGGFDNPENIEAKKLGIQVLTQGEAIAKFQNGDILGRKFEGISVAGTHGKTTTTAMIATILKANKLDPSFAIGTGMIPFLGSNGHFGKGKYFIAEADEYAVEPIYDKTAKMLKQNPQVGVITSIEFDHPDIYGSIDELKDAFLKFVNGINPNGLLVINIDAENTKDLLKKYKGNIKTYGFSKAADFYIDRINVEQEKTFFWVYNHNVNLGEFSINVAGEHNALNALGAIVVCLELGLSFRDIKEGLLSFKGSKRRLEYAKETEYGAMIFDDYAHHPTEIRKTLETLKKAYPNKKIVCIFQPHTYSRTKVLFEQFSSSFNDAFELLLTEIYPSQREMPDLSVSSRMLAQNISKIKKEVFYLEKLDDVVKYVDQKAYGRDFILVTMGAGDVYKIIDYIK